MSDVVAQAIDAAHRFVVQAQVGREHIALQHLRRQRFDSFCPSHCKLRRAGRHTTNQLSPYFPGYLFVHLDLDRQRWRSINGTIGVVRIISFGAGGRLTPLPHGFAERLQSLLWRVARGAPRSASPRAIKCEWLAARSMSYAAHWNEPQIGTG